MFTLLALIAVLNGKAESDTMIITMMFDILALVIISLIVLIAI